MFLLNQKEKEDSRHEMGEVSLCFKGGKILFTEFMDELPA